MKHSIQVGGASFALEVGDEPDDDVRRLVAETVWGTSGGLLYRNRTTQWDRMPRTKTVTLRSDSGELASVAVLAEMSWGYYVALLSSAPRYRSQGLAARLIRLTVEILSPQVGPTKMIAGLVVGDNTAARSSIRRSGHDVAAEIDALLFSRRYPRPSPRCSRLSAAQREPVLRELERLDRGWQDAATSLIASEYFVCEAEGKVVAGVQCCPQVWDLLSLGSTFDPLLLRCLPWLIGSPAHHLTFLQLFHVWGEVKYLEELFAHVLHEAGACLASIQLDPRDALWPHLRHKMRRGIAAHLVGVDTMHVYANGPIPRPLSVCPIMGTVA